MPKLSKKEFILRAAKLYGLGEVEIGALSADLDGTMPNEFIERRTKPLFRLYETYMSNDFNEAFDTDENGIINLNDYSFEISKRRLADSKIGNFWIVSSNLEAFLSVKTPQDVTSNVKEKFVPISEKNNFLIPQLAKQMALNATVYYKGEYTDQYGTFSTHHLTKNFLYDEETLIQGNSIIKADPRKRRISLETILDGVDKYLKKYYKKNKLPQKDLEKARREIREGLIKQTFFNKLLFNTNESNEKWGLIIGEDKNLRLAPIFSYDYFAGVESVRRTQHRAVQGNREDIESLMLQYSDEYWFRTWIERSVLPINFDKAKKEMERITGITLTQEEEEYYKYVLDKIYPKVKNVYELDYDRELVEKSKEEKLGKKILRAKYTISDKFIDLKNKRNRRPGDQTGEGR